MKLWAGRVTALAAILASGMAVGGGAEAPAGSYSPGAPFLGIHGGPLNDTWIPESLPTGYAKAWDSLDGPWVFQPPVFSPDGRALYATAKRMDPANSVLAAMDPKTGNILWKEDAPLSAGGSPLVDDGGIIYLAQKAEIVARDASGQALWRVPVDSQGFGMHLDSGGRLVFCSGRGVLYLVSRDGKMLSSLDIPAVYGFSRGVMRDGTFFAGLSNLIGTNGYTSNTIAISGDEIFVVGKSDQGNSGALVRVRISGDDLIPDGFAYVPDGGKSGASPAISPDGRHVVVSGGGLASGGYYAVYDSRTLEKEASFPKQGGVAKGSAAIDGDDCVIWGGGSTVRRTCSAPEGMKDAWTYEAGETISSLVTATENQVLFQTMRGTRYTVHGLDRHTGAELWSSPSSGISMGTIAVGPGGDLYVTIGMGKYGLEKLVPVP